MSESSESDVQRAWREKREGFAAAADMIGKLLTAWEDSQSECCVMHAELVGAERDLTRLLDVVVHAGGRDWTAAQDAADRLKSIRSTVSRASGGNEWLRAVLHRCASEMLDAAGGGDIPCLAVHRGAGCLSRDPEEVRACMERDRAAFVAGIADRVLQWWLTRAAGEVFRDDGATTPEGSEG